jgi:hypothetical protein
MRSPLLFEHPFQGWYWPYENQYGCYNGYPCPAGYYCPDGSNGPSSCPAGYYCPNATSTYYACPGVFLSLICISYVSWKHYIRLLFAFFFSQGWYWPSSYQDTCSYGMNGFECPAGYFCPEGASTYYACPGVRIHFITLFNFMHKMKAIACYSHFLSGLVLAKFISRVVHLLFEWFSMSCWVLLSRCHVNLQLLPFRLLLSLRSLHLHNLPRGIFSFFHADV